MPFDLDSAPFLAKFTVGIDEKRTAYDAHKFAAIERLLQPLTGSRMASRFSWSHNS